MLDPSLYGPNAMAIGKGIVDYRRSADPHIADEPSGSIDGNIDHEIVIDELRQVVVREEL